MLRIRVAISVEKGQLLSSRLFLAESFSAEIFGATSSEEERIRSWLSAYTTKSDFPPLSFQLNHLSAFQQRVLLEMGKIPFGQTISYQELAGRCGIPLGARAIGGACHRNPLPLFFPCHRVIKKSREIGGFAADLEIKKRLLSAEGAY